MTEWVRHEAATAALGGIPVDQLEHSKRDALVSHTPLPDGTATISLTLHVNGVGSREFAKELMKQHAGEALRRP